LKLRKYKLPIKLVNSVKKVKGKEIVPNEQLLQNDKKIMMEILVNKK
jgi:hypothetical protein